MYKNPLIITILGTFVCLLVILFWSIYQYHVLLSADDAGIPLVEVSSGTLTVVRGETAYDLGRGESLEIEEGDRILSEKNSLSVIRWPDASITRVGEMTEIVIREMSVEEDLSEIRVSLDLKKGKVWTNLVRTLFGNSHFNTRLPDERVTAAVRGTIFEINIRNNYIHSVNHGMTLTDPTGRSAELLPGDIVKADNIFEKLSREALDASWNLLNEYADIEYINERTEFVKARINTLAIEKNWFDVFVRWLLSLFPYFDRIKVAEMLEGGSDGLTSLSEDVTSESLTRWYADLQNTNYSLELRQLLREKILLTVPDEKREDIETTLIYGAIWDRFTASGRELAPSLDGLLASLSGSMPKDAKEAYRLLSTPTYREKLEKTIAIKLQELRGMLRSSSLPVWDIEGALESLRRLKFDQ